MHPMTGPQYRHPRAPAALPPPWENRGPPRWISSLSPASWWAEPAIAGVPPLRNEPEDDVDQSWPARTDSGRPRTSTVSPAATDNVIMLPVFLTFLPSRGLLPELGALAVFRWMMSLR